MNYDEEGFLYPAIDIKACINCHACEAVCPELHIKAQDRILGSYVARSNNKQIRLHSSSGGVFSLLSGEVLKKGGSVCGAEWDSDFTVHHTCVEDEKHFSALRGSKYLQSNKEYIYRKVEDLLKAGRPVLFSGVACEIAGLKGFLRQPYDNLVTVDVICHGVPSPMVWRRYLNELVHKHGASIKRVNFRDKKSGWKDYSLSIVFNNGKIYREYASDNVYMNLFLKNAILRPSCAKCPFKDMNHCSDITLADAWGIGQYAADMDDDMGTSAVIVHTQAGKRLFEAVLPQMEARRVPFEKIVPANPSYNTPSKPHALRGGSV